MIDLKSIHDMWEKDCVIDDMRLDESSRQAPILHAKYLQLLSTVKLQLKRAEFSQKTLLKQKWLWYNGKMDPIAMNELGWDPDPFDGLKVLKGDMDYYYDSDPIIQKAKAAIDYTQEICDVLKEILENIKWRHQNIKNMIEWRKFTSGI